MSAHGTNGSRASQPNASTPGQPGTAVLPAGGLPTPSGSMSELRQRRLELAERVATLTWDLGGLAYEMAIRDHYRLDVLARRASELQEADAQLGEVQRLLAGAEAGIHGQCRSCGAVRSRGAAFCWHCGVALQIEARPSVLGASSSGSPGPGQPGATSAPTSVDDSSTPPAQTAGDFSQSG